MPSYGPKECDHNAWLCGGFLLYTLYVRGLRLFALSIELELLFLKKCNQNICYQIDQLLICLAGV